MSEISRFFGIVVFMNVQDHGPPHFHARYQGRFVSIDIRTLRLLRGRMHPRALGLIMEWAALHRAELLARWDVAVRGKNPERIDPLD